MGRRKTCFKCGSRVTTRIRFDFIAEEGCLLPYTRKTDTDCCNACSIDVFRHIASEANDYAAGIADKMIPDEEDEG